MLAAVKELSRSHVDDMKREKERAVVSARTLEKTSAKEFRFEGEIFFVKVTIVCDSMSGFMKIVSSFTITRDAALENIFDKPSESAASNASWGITSAGFRIFTFNRKNERIHPDLYRKLTNVRKPSCASNLNCR